MKKALYWLRDHWYLPLFAIGVVLGWWLTRKSGKLPPLDQIKTELKAIEAGKQARELEAKVGAEAATREVHKLHAAALQKLDQDQAAKAAELKSDPAALSRFLVRAGRKPS